MNVLVVLIPVSIALGAAGLAACLWTLRHGQYEDLEGDAARILLDDEAPPPDPGPEDEDETHRPRI
ncbi:cbb3-type cytochrome oxidase assembly protein CcoS [Salipiger sp. IMCC34102]|uniref:cbb3-type cytochrome oxidase assembly protein CcoS n=1 Tax=Salipiger sp. IMCC34102 TaxID=2510647 RepID=UPI00101DCD9A|nr:cbb3-type cytochrome oxidase assembly protein CcoS [Salipiger sp. IMCC34102]RYH02599.1 cbb3-type cytochrome oxidase assembly protein CcoS [Salipiger sp. IMCC34102]